jgi:hypothetical protein
MQRQAYSFFATRLGMLVCVVGMFALAALTIELTLTWTTHHPDEGTLLKYVYLNTDESLMMNLDGSCCVIVMMIFGNIAELNSHLFVVFKLLD